MTGTEQPRPAPVGDASRTGWAWSPTLVAYGVAAFTALIAFETPVAVVTMFEGAATPDAAVEPFPQWLVAVGLAIAAAGGRLRRAWPAVFTLALLLIVGGGLAGARGGELLIDMKDSDAGGEIGLGSVVVPVAAALATAAVVFDCRAHLERINRGRRDVWGWCAAVLAGPQVAMFLLVAAGIAAGGTSGAVLAGIAPIVGGTLGGLLVRRWATRPGEL